MKDWFEFWENEKNRLVVHQLCRDEEIFNNSIMAFVVNTQNIGCCCECLGQWVWSNDIKKLASYFQQIQLKNLCGIIKNVDSDDLPSMSCTSYAKELSSDGGIVNNNIYELSKQMDEMLESEYLSIDKLKKWADDLQRVSWKTPQILTINIYEKLEDGIKEMDMHEKVRNEDNSKYSLKQRFSLDYIE